MPTNIVTPDLDTQQVYNTYKNQLDYYKNNKDTKTNSYIFIKNLLNNTKAFTYLDNYLYDNLYYNGSALINGFDLNFLRYNNNKLEFIIRKGIAIVDGNILLLKNHQNISIDVSNILSFNYDKIVSVIYYSYQDLPTPTYSIYLYAIDSQFTNNLNPMRNNNKQDWNIKKHNLITDSVDIFKNNDNTFNYLMPTFKSITPTSDLSNYPYYFLIKNRRYPFPNYPSNIQELIQSFNQELIDIKHNPIYYRYLKNNYFNLTNPFNNFYFHVLKLLG